MNINTNTYTDLENEVINGFLNAEEGYGYRGGYSFFDNGVEVGSDTWGSVFVEELGDPKIYRGVISSLVQKGFFRSFRADGDTAILLTQLAVDEINSRQGEVA